MSNPADMNARDRVRGRTLRQTMFLVTLAWVFGSVWQTATAGAPITLFAKSLGASNFQFGLLAAIPFLVALLSMPASVLIESTGKRKGIFLIGLTVMRVMWFPIALVPIWIFHTHGAGVAMGVFLVLMFIMQAGQAVGGPAWTPWMADIVPDAVRGRYFSRRKQWGVVSALPAALIVGWYLDQYVNKSSVEATLWGCAIIFMISAVFGLADIQLFHWVPASDPPPRKGSHLLQAMKIPLRDRQFLIFCGFVAVLTFAVSFMGQFVTLYLIERIKVNATQTQLITLVAPLVAQFFVFSIWGHAADRMGKKPVLVIAALGLAPVALGWSFLGQSNIWLAYLLSAAGAALWAGVDTANFNIMLEMSATKDEEKGGGSAYVAVNTLIVSIFGFLGGFTSGAIAEALRSWEWKPIGSMRAIEFFDVLFVLSGGLRFLSVIVFLPYLHEPRARPTVEALRFMTANIYNNLFNVVTLPLRAVGFRRAAKGKSQELP